MVSGELPFFKVSDFGTEGNEHYLHSCSNWVSREAARALGAAAVPAGSVLLPKIGAALLGNARRMTTRPAVFDNNVLAIVPTRADSRYLYYWLSTRDLAELANPGPIPSLSDSALLDAVVPCSSLIRQRSIADFLDAETARIDALVAKKRELGRLLEMRWRTILRHLLGDTGRQVVPLRRLWTVTDCKHRTPDYVDDGFPVVSPGDVAAGRLDLRRCHRFVASSDFEDLTEGGRRPLRGDIVYSRNASIGIAAYVDTSDAFTMGQDVCLIRSASENQLWLMYVLNSLGVDQLAQMKVGTTFDRVNISQLLDLQIPVPPRSVQDVEAVKLDQERRRIDRLHIGLQAQVALLRERRQALISAAVTGKLDIVEA